MAFVSFKLFNIAVVTFTVSNPNQSDHFCDNRYKLSFAMILRDVIR